MSEENLATLKRGYDAYNRGVIPAELLTPDVKWGTSGGFPGVEGSYEAPAAIQEWFDVIQAEWEWNTGARDVISVKQLDQTSSFTARV